MQMNNPFINQLEYEASKGFPYSHFLDTYEHAINFNNYIKNSHSTYALESLVVINKLFDSYKKNFGVDVK